MVFKRGVALLVLAAALVSVEGAPIKVHTELKNPIVKDVKSEHGKLTLTLQEGAKVHKKPVAKKTHAKKPVAAKYADVKKQEVKKLEAKKPFSVKVASKKDQHKKHPEVKKHSEVKNHAVAKKSAHKQVSEEKKENGEVIRKYAHGQVRVMAKNQPAAETDAHAKKHPHVKKVAAKKATKADESNEEVEIEAEVKKSAHKKSAHKKAAHKKVAAKKATKDDESNEEVEIEAEVKKSAHKKAAHKKVAAKKATKADESNEEVEIEAEVKKASKQVEGEEDEEANVDLKVGEEVTIEFGGHSVGLELQANGSLILTADDETYVLPQADSVDLTFEEDELDSEASSGSSDAETEVSSAAGSVAAADDVSLLDEVEGEASVVAKKFTELATKLTGNGKFFSKEAAPVVFVGGVIGALAAIVGIAAIAIGRSRGDAAAADPASVLADATEDVEAGVSAENSEDAAADETQSLDSSDSESDAEEEQEEGKFANEVASV